MNDMLANITYKPYRW